MSCQRQGACPRLMIVFKSKHIPQCTSARLSYAHTDGQRKAGAHASANRIIFLPPVIVSHVFTMPLCINMSVSTSGNPQRKNHMLILILSNNEKAKSWSLNSHKAQRDSRAWKERVVNLKRHPERTRIMRVKCEWFRPFSITFAEKKKLINLSSKKGEQEIRSHETSPAPVPALKALFLNPPPTHLRGSRSAAGLVFPFSTLGCTAARPVGNRGSFFKVDWSCHVIAARGKTVRRKRRRVGTRKEQQLLFQPLSLSNDVCLLRRTCGHCANVEQGGVMNVSAGELRSKEVKKVNLSLAVSGSSTHTIRVTSP